MCPSTQRPDYQSQLILFVWQIHHHWQISHSAGWKGRDKGSEEMLETFGYFFNCKPWHGFGMLLTHALQKDYSSLCINGRFVNILQSDIFGCPSHLLLLAHWLSHFSDRDFGSQYFGPGSLPGCMHDPWENTCTCTVNIRCILGNNLS